MKKIIFKLILSGFILLLIIPSCKKEKEEYENPYTFSHRVISQKYYYNNQLQGETLFEYSDSKLTRISGDEEDMLITYPDKNKIILKEQGDESEYISLNLSNNRVTELIAYKDGDPDYKATYGYNSEGNISKINYYSYESGWDLEEEIAFTYTSGRLTKIVSVEEEDDEEQYEYTYEGDQIANMISSYKHEGEWITEHKKVYNDYGTGRVRRITHYYYDGGWYQQGYIDYEYDSNDNLIKETSSDWGEGEDKIEYTYEEGSGNMRLFAAVEFDLDEVGQPLPNKMKKGIPGFPALFNSHKKK